MPRPSLALLAVCIIGGAWMERPSVAQQQPPFRIDTRLVEVPVVVHDRQGRPVTDLTAEDFRLYEDGREQPFELFDRMGGRAIARGAQDPAVPAARDLGVFADMAPREIEGNLTAILFDRLNTKWEDQAQARGQILKFLEGMRPGDRIAVYALDGGAVSVLHDFSDDRASLARTIEKAARLTSRERDAADATPLPQADPSDAAMTAFLERSNRLFAEAASGLGANATITALQNIGRHLASVRGRKNLVWISGGFPLRALLTYGTSMSAEIQRATRALNNAQTTIYSVDARGLIGAFTYDRGRPVVTTLSTVYTNLDILTITADETGGRAFYNTNDLAGAIHRALDDARDTYLLAYYPSHGQWDGRYRQIRVRVNRPGLEVRHRRGYFASPIPNQSPSPATDSGRIDTAERCCRAVFRAESRITNHKSRITNHGSAGFSISEPPTAHAASA